MMRKEMEERKIERVDYSAEMTNEEYRTELRKMLDEIESNRLLRYFYIFVSEKLKRVP